MLGPCSDKNQKMSMGQDIPVYIPVGFHRNHTDAWIRKRYKTRPHMPHYASTKFISTLVTTVTHRAESEITNQLILADEASTKEV